MRIVIVGQQWFGAEVLKLCVSRGDDVLKVIAPRENDRLSEVAAGMNINVQIDSGLVDEHMLPDDLDLIVAAHAHAFISTNARRATYYGALGYHPSLLPRHRGRDSVRWAIHMGDAITGGTVYWMDDGADTGPIAAQDWCHIQPGDDAKKLWRRDLAPMGLRLFESVLAGLDKGVVPATPQLEICATWEPRFSAGKLSAG